MAGFNRANGHRDEVSSLTLRSTPSRRRLSFRSTLGAYSNPNFHFHSSSSFTIFTIITTITTTTTTGAGAKRAFLRAFPFRYFATQRPGNITTTPSTLARKGDAAVVPSIARWSLFLRTAQPKSCRCYRIFKPRSNRVTSSDVLYRDSSFVGEESRNLLSWSKLPGISPPNRAEENRLVGWLVVRSRSCLGNIFGWFPRFLYSEWRAHD